MKKTILLLVLAGASYGQITEVRGKVGPVTGADQTAQELRMGRSAELIVADGHAVYQESVSRGGVFTVSVVQATIATANNSPLGAGGTPLVGIFNPANSPKNLVVLRAVIGTASGTPAAQPFCVWNVIPAPAGITAAGAQGVNNFTFQAAGSVAKSFSNSAITGSVAATALRIIGGTAAIAAGAGIYSVTEDTKGEIVVPPGAFAGIACGNGAGTTWIVSAALSWEEVFP